MASTTTATRTAAPTRTPLQIVAMIVGATFLLVGILGFVPGVTQNFEGLALAGQESDAMLLGIFEVSILHNIVHLLFGVIGLGAARAVGASRSFLVGAGLIYLALFAYGMVIDRASELNFVPLNEADDWLHLGVGAGMVVLGLALPGRTADTRTERIAG